MKDDNYIFEKYLDGMLEGDSLLQFLERLKTDADFASRFELYKRMDDLLHRMHQQVYGIKKLSESSKAPDVSELKNIEEDIENYLGSKGETLEAAQLRAKLKILHKKLIPGLRFRKSAWIGIAASVVLLAALSVVIPRVFLKESKQERIFSKHYEAYPFVFNSKGNTTDEPVVLYNAVYLYQMKDYASALVLFRQLSDSTVRNDVATLFAGICYIELDQYDEAKESFQAILTRKNSLVQDHARWYLGLTCLKMNQVPEALTIFSSIRICSSEFYLPAQDIIRSLK